MNNIIVWSADKRISGFVFFAFQYQKKIISKTSTKSGSSKTRQKQFFEDLTTLLNAQEEKRPVMEHQNDYILHIELSADETNAVISLQRKGNYEFVFRNEIISLKKIGNQNK